ncbi:MAG: CbtA family protein [Rhodopila sp.]
MIAFRSIVFSAVLSGLIVGCLVTGVQRLATIPLIQQAEVYERQSEAGGYANDHTASAPAAPAARDHEHEHGQAAWEPADGFERTAYTALFNVVDWIGFGLLLNGAIVLLRRPADWREGMLWGLGAFVAFVIAPAIGLPPELPGEPAAPLLQRQMWWVDTVAATAAGLGLIAFRRSLVGAVLGIALLIAPHLIGAPQAEHGDSLTTQELTRQFIVAVTVSALPCWALLGALTGYFYRRFSQAA